VLDAAAISLWAAAGAHERELESDPQAMKRRCARAEQPQHPGHLGKLAGRLGVLIALSAMSSPNHWTCS